MKHRNLIARDARQRRSATFADRRTKRRRDRGSRRRAAINDQEKQCQN